MKIRMFIGGMVLGAASVLGVADALSQDQGHQMSDEEAAMMEAWQKFSSTGAEHELLKRLAGSWETSSQLTMGGAAGPAEAGKANFRLILDDRFVEHDFDGAFMGQHMEGRGTIGYDNFKKKYVMSWIDNLGTAIHYAEGMLDQTGSTLTFWGTMDEWMTGEHDKPVKYVYRFLEEGKMRFEVHDLAIIPGETKVLQITYSRAPSE